MKHLLTLWWTCLTIATASAAGEIRFAPEKDYGPFVSETAAGGVEGLSIDMLAAIKEWVHEAEASGIQSLRDFAHQLKTYSLRPATV